MTASDASKYPRRKSIDCLLNTSLLSELANGDSYDRNALADRQEK